MRMKRGARLLLERLVPGAGAADDEHLLQTGLECKREIQGATQIQTSNEAGGVWEVRHPGIAEEDDGRAGEEVVAIFLDEGSSRIL